VLALAALDSRLHDAGEGAIDQSRVAGAEVATYLLDAFSGVRPVEARSFSQRLLILQLLEQVNHEFVAIMLHYGLESTPQDLLQGWPYDPVSISGRLAEHDVIKVMDAVAELKVVVCARLAPLLHILVPLHHVVVPQLRNR